jgi:hypothetical protein
VRYYYANAAALATARSGKALPDGSSMFVEVYDAKLDGKNNAITGSDNVFVPDKLVRYVAIARDAGWDEDIRNCYATTIGATRFSRPTSNTRPIRPNASPAEGLFKLA